MTNRTLIQIHEYALHSEAENLPCPLMRSCGYKQELCLCEIPKTRHQFYDEPGIPHCTEAHTCLPRQQLPLEARQEIDARLS